MDQSQPQTSRERHRLGMVAGIVVFAGLIGLGAWALAPRAVGAPGPAGPRLSISLVAPLEPVLVDGGVLDVGLLNDGFDRAVLERSAEMPLTDAAPADAYAGQDLPPLNLMPEPRPMVRQTTSSEGSRITSTDPLSDGSSLFGFDRRPIDTESPPSEASPNVAILGAAATKADTLFK